MKHTIHTAGHDRAELQRLHGQLDAERRSAQAWADRAHTAETRCDQLTVRVAALEAALGPAQATRAERVRLAHQVQQLGVYLAMNGIDPATGQPQETPCPPT